MFFFKRSKIHLDCFTHREDSLEYFQPDRALKYAPKWWKNLPKSYINENDVPTNTMKKCPGFVNFYKKSFILPLWTDIVFDVENNQELSDARVRAVFSDGLTGGDIHNKKQFGNFFDKKYTHCKIYSPWFFKCKQEVYFHYGPAFWNQEQPDNYLVAQGLLEFKYQYATHVNLFLNASKQKNLIKIESGTPLVQILPLTEKEIVLHNHLVSIAEVNKMSKSSETMNFTDSYLNKKKILKERE